MPLRRSKDTKQYAENSYVIRVGVVPTRAFAGVVVRVRSSSSRALHSTTMGMAPFAEIGAVVNSVGDAPSSQQGILQYHTFKLFNGFFEFKVLSGKGSRCKVCDSRFKVGDSPRA
eukprot:7119026-Pyramimonas_sp.AAC.1